MQAVIIEKGVMSVLCSECSYKDVFEVLKYVKTVKSILSQKSLDKIYRHVVDIISHPTFNMTEKQLKTVINFISPKYACDQFSLKVISIVEMISIADPYDDWANRFMSLKDLCDYNVEISKVWAAEIVKNLFTDKYKNIEILCKWAVHHEINSFEKLFEDNPFEEYQSLKKIGAFWDDQMFYPLINAEYLTEEENEEPLYYVGEDIPENPDIQLSEDAGKEDAIIRILEDRKKDGFVMKDWVCNKHSPSGLLHFAAQKGYRYMFNYLLENGCDIEAVGANGHSVRYFAIQHVQRMLEEPDSYFVKMLLSKVFNNGIFVTATFKENDEYESDEDEDDEDEDEDDEDDEDEDEDDDYESEEEDDDDPDLEEIELRDQNSIKIGSNTLIVGDDHFTLVQKSDETITVVSMDESEGVKETIV